MRWRDARSRSACLFRRHSNNGRLGCDGIRSCRSRGGFFGDQEARPRALGRLQNERVSRQTAPGRQVDLDRRFAGKDFQKLARNRGSICFRINNKRPLPQSIVPPSKLAAMVGVSSADGCMVMARSVVWVLSVSQIPRHSASPNETHTPTRKLERPETQSDEESKRRRERSDCRGAATTAVHAPACSINTKSRRLLAT